MIGISISTYKQLNRDLYCSSCDSGKYGKIQLFHSIYDTSDWGEPQDIIYLKENSCTPITFSFCIKNGNNSIGNYINFDILPSLIKGYLVVGVASEGFICLWDYSKNKSHIYKHIRLSNPNFMVDDWMKQFTYRYQVFLEYWDEDEEKWIKYDEEKDEVIPEFEYIEESLFDGTHDKLHDGGLMKYHEAGKPKKLALKWHIKKSDYSAYFWFEDEEICAIFNKFYGQHPDTKTDFIIHIDPIKKKYELSLYRYGLKEPVIIPKTAYQLIVFKSGFENYRSDNYNQPTGAWIW